MVKLAREMDELASDVVVHGMVPQRRLLAASCGERCLSCCAPSYLLVSLACVGSVHACRRLQCRRDAWHCAWCHGMVAASPVSPHSLSQFFLHVVLSALGGTLVNSLLRVYGLLHRHRSKRVNRKKKEKISSLAWSQVLLRCFPNCVSCA